ncbi:NUDIX hydrolase [Amycolatopsis methanolica 239]|uniref:NUDIX hydrolase n=1 Tax=Amycolatopsis methanolica 239 TaxID=1068978 RepID=A0A076MWX5_AMYME|nr:NUDIX hydrolase [Amycolatopsis methanolica 239]
MEPRLGLFFLATRWTGETVNREPDKCSAIDWFPLDNLPTDLISYPAAGIHAYLTGQPFAILGWPATEAPAAMLS